PLGVLTSRSDPKNRPLVVDLVGQYRDKVHPVGRLDFNTEGLLLLTNDGDFTNLITGSKQASKVYEVKVKGKPSEHQIAMLKRGVTVGGKRTAPAEIRLMEESEMNAWYRVTLYEGRNQQIRKMFDHIGHSVIKLRRVAIGFLKNERLKPGEFRMLSEIEVKKFCRMGKNSGIRRIHKLTRCCCNTFEPRMKRSRSACSSRSSPRASSRSSDRSYNPSCASVLIAVAAPPPTRTPKT